MYPLTSIDIFGCYSVANGGIAYLYARKKFGWDAPDWALYVSVISSTGSLGISPSNLTDEPKMHTYEHRGSDPRSTFEWIF